MDLLLDQIKQKLQKLKPGTVAYPCNPSYLRGSDWEDRGLRPAQAKILKTPSRLIKSWVPWHVPAIPAMWEAYIGGSLSRLAWA
jgi:hypothetical protein